VATADAPGPEARNNEDRDYVNSLARGLNVMRAFNRDKPSMTLSEVARETGINRAAARRFLLTLVREGYVETDGKYFRLRPKILELGFSALSTITFSEITQPAMDDLAERLDEMCLAVVLDGEWSVYVARSLSRRLMSVNLDVGSRLPAFAMSSGRVLLAALSDEELARWLRDLRPVRYTEKTIVSKRRLRDEIVAVRRQGWAIMDQEYEIGLRSLSVPIVDRAGSTIAALNVCCPSARVSIDQMTTNFLPELRRAARQISESLPDTDVRIKMDLRPVAAGAPPG
jgi:IclR family pca regulon transcriptional regulator